MVGIDAARIEEALEDVLHGHSFSSSKQCQALLRYVVKHTLDDRANMLRERVIGAEVFGRPPDYDTGNDPVVRSRAAEVRKRLAQHYMHEGSTPNEVRIDIPSGSYRATFDFREAQPRIRETPLVSETPTPKRTPPAVWDALPVLDHQPAVSEPISVSSDTPTLPAQQSNQRLVWRPGLALIVVFAMILSVVHLWPFHTNSEIPYDRFWSPFTGSSKSAIVYFGGSYTYHLSSRFLANYRSEHHAQNDGSELIQGIQSGGMLNAQSLIPSNPTIGYGDVAAVARIASTLTHLCKKYDLRYGSDLTVTDLHAFPTVFIGGFSNMWTLQLTQDFRYTLDQGGIVDRQQHKLTWVQGASADGLRNEDYAVVSRIPNSALGSPTLFIAGINTYSNQAAADFISDPERIRTLTRSLGKGWEERNLQFVLHATVINQVPIAAEVVAVYTW